MAEVHDIAVGILTEETWCGHILDEPRARQMLKHGALADEEADGRARRTGRLCRVSGGVDFAAGVHGGCACEA